ncbi:MAG: sulfatase-like hydrolase/transferase [Prevotella sp.]|jgi:arylsulfatase A-like enzyme|nr:sulfatase-like hydrolase/transferase [Prevotella sp.]
MKHKSLILFTGLPFISCPVFTQNHENQANQPNIIFILTDDMGIGDLSVYGGTLMQTPNIDRMASEGIRFTQYYSASPISSPSRAGLLTGNHPAKWNITSYLQTKKGNKAAEMADYLTTKAPTLPHTLKSAKYKTAHFGKWHLGGGRDVTDAPGFEEYGYDEYSSTYESPYPDPLLTATDWIWSKKDSVKRWDRTAYFIDKTIDFLKKHKGTPCFVNLWPDDIHTPWIGNKEEMQLFPADAESEKNFKTVLIEYDKQIGRLIDRLKEEGLDKNTIVIFTSDNGPAPSFRHSRTNQLRGCKASLFEGGIRMPFIVWSPDKTIPKGKVNKTSVISAMDMFVSICSIANAPLPNSMFDGEDMSKAILGKEVKREKGIFWEYRRNNDGAFPKPGNEKDRSPNLSMREGDWKLLINYDNSDVMLFNLKNDIYEKNNIAEKYPKITKRLKEKVIKWRSSLPKLE